MTYRERFLARVREIDRRNKKAAKTVDGRTWEVLKMRRVEGVYHLTPIMWGLTETEALRTLAKLSKRNTEGASYDIAPSEI